MATRLDLNYDAQVLAVRTRVTEYARRYWAGLGSWRDADADRLIAALVPRVEAGQARVAQLTDAYIARVAAGSGAIVRGAVADVSTESLRGVPADEVYQRPFVEMRTNLAEGSTVTTAVAAGGARLLSLVSTGQQLAKTHSARQAIDRSGAAGFERVLTGRENCSLCVIASTQRYHRGNLLPIHPGCDCGVRPIKGDPDEQIINPERLESIHDAITAEFGTSDRAARYIDGGKDRGDYTDLLVTYKHGELGPTLAWRDQHHTGPAGLQ
jgi:hypothetical protein